jgi:hypothetical protein
MSITYKEAAKLIRERHRAQLPKAWIGVDPGAKGAYVLIGESGVIHVMDWVNSLVASRTINFWLELWDIKLVVIEKVHGMKGNSARSNTTFMQHVGEWRAVLNLCELNWTEARPDQWMKRRLPAKVHKRDKPSVKYVMKRYPEIKLQGPRGGFKDGRSDAICIAEYARDKERRYKLMIKRGGGGGKKE